MCHKDGWFTASCSSPMLLATHASGADEGARTPDLDVVNVVFFQLNYIRESTMMSVRSTRS